MNFLGRWRKQRREQKIQMLLEGRALKCPGCNTLTQLEGFDTRQMAEALVRMGLKHLPNCVIGGTDGNNRT